MEEFAFVSGAEVRVAAGSVTAYAGGEWVGGNGVWRSANAQLQPKMVWWQCVGCLSLLQRPSFSLQGSTFGPPSSFCACRMVSLCHDTSVVGCTRGSETPSAPNCSSQVAFMRPVCLNITLLCHKSRRFLVTSTASFPFKWNNNHWYKAIMVLKDMA